MTERPKSDHHRDGFADTEIAPTQRADAVTQDRPHPPPRAVSASPPSRTVGRFRLEAELGSGGMGNVYRAHDPVLDRAVALKVLHTGGAADGTQGMRRVIREARAAAALTHPNTVTIFEVGEADGEVFIAMELLEGEDLRAVIERGTATFEQKLRRLLEAARALDAAHARGLVHRDVKPENMFVCKDGTLKLLDFGIAKRHDPGHDDDDGLGAAGHGMGPSSLRTEAGRRVGTPRYMAPEQHAGEATDPRTDEYAWALVAHELLTGAHGGEALPTMTREGGATTARGDDGTLADRGAALRVNVPALTPLVAATIARALEPDKERRFPSMTPIVAALEAKPSPAEGLAAGPAAPAPPAAPAAPTSASTPTASRRRPWRLPLAVALGAGVVVAALVRQRSAHSSRSSATSPGTSVPACRLSSTRTVPLTDADRIAMLPDGRVLVAKGFRTRLAFEQLTPEGSVPAMQHPLLDVMKVEADDDLVLTGTTYQGKPALAMRVMQGERGELFAALGDGQAWVNQRVFGPVTDLVSTPFGTNLAVIVTTAAVPPRRFGLPSGTEAYLVTPTGAERRTIEVSAGALAPAVATRGEQLAIAYSAPSGIRFALLDRRLDRIGDVLEVASTGSYPAVGFAAATAVVFWVDSRDGKTRLYRSGFTPGELHFTAPAVAIDEPLGPKAPVTAGLPGGAWAVAWVASTGGLSTLRVSPVGAGGALDAATEIAKSPAIDGLRAISTSTGITYLWHENDHTVRIAEVTCVATSPL